MALVPDRDNIIRDRYTNFIELTMASEVRFDKISASCGGDDFSVATGKKLWDAIDVVVVAMCAYNVVLSLAFGIERLVVVILDWPVLKILP